MLSQKTRYALRALVELARVEGTQLTSGELAVRADAPRKFLEAILLELARNRIVISRSYGDKSFRRSAHAVLAEVSLSCSAP